MQIVYDKGDRFLTDEALVDVDEHTASGEKPVRIEGTFGVVTGQGFQLLDKGTVMIVQGPATATLYLHGKGGSDKPNASPFGKP